MREMYRIQFEQVGWPPPVKREVDGGAYARAIYKLALIARKMCAEVLSPKARSMGDGVAASTVEMVLYELAAWNTDPALDGQVDYLAEGSECRDDRFETRRCYCLASFFALHLTHFSAVHDFGIRDDADGRVQGLLLQATLHASSQLARVAKRCISLNIVDAAPNILRNVPAAYVLWIAWTVANRWSELSWLQLSDMHGNALDLVASVRSAKSRKDSEYLSSALQSILDRSFRGHEFVSTASSSYASVGAGTLSPRPPSSSLPPSTQPLPLPASLSLNAQSERQEHDTLVASKGGNLDTADFLGDLEQEIQHFCAALGLDLPNNPSALLPTFDILLS